MRYRLTDAARRLQQQGIERASALLHRSLGRRLQQVDELEYRVRGTLREALARNGRRALDLDARLRRMDLRLRFAAGWRRLEAAQREAAERMRLRMVLVRGRLDSLSAATHAPEPARHSGARLRHRAGRKRQGDQGGRRRARRIHLDVRLAKGRLRANVTRVYSSR